MKLLITGGAGFIGSNFVRYWLSKYPNDSVINMDKLTYAGNLSSLKDIENNQNHRFVKGDICDKKLVDELVSQVDVVVHFAAESHNDQVNNDPLTALHTNIVGTENLLSSAFKNGKKRFHHISTDEVFGHLESTEGLFTEETKYNPRSFYPASKAASDFWVRAYFNTKGLPVTISNCSNNFGPYQYPEKIIPLFVTNLLSGKKVPVYGDGSNIRDWLYVEDHCIAIDLILKKGKIGETYNVGTNCEKTNLNLTKKIIKLIGLDDSMIDYVNDRPAHDWRYAIDASKIKTQLGWEPQYNFEQSLKETVEWYQKNEWWWNELLSRDS